MTTATEPAPREIPEGKVLTTTHVDDSNRARVTVLEERDAKGRTYRLIRSSPGFEPAGSSNRWTNGYYGVLYYADGANHGRSTRDEAEARRLFEKWTTS